jgi:hypothetical protein
VEVESAKVVEDDDTGRDQILDRLARAFDLVRSTGFAK